MKTKVSVKTTPKYKSKYTVASGLLIAACSITFLVFSFILTTKIDVNEISKVTPILVIYAVIMLYWFAVYFIYIMYSAKKEISQESEKFSSIATSLSRTYDAIFYVNITNDSYTRFNVNDKFNEFKFDEDDGRNFFDSFLKDLDGICPEEDRKVVINFLRKSELLKSLQGGDAASTEYRINFKNKEIYYRLKALKSNDKNHIVVALENVDSYVRNEKEKQRAMAAALDMANSAANIKTTFLNNVSRDVRTPMNAIIGYASLIGSHIDEKEQVLDYVGKIVQSSNKLLSLINGVLDISRIEAGKVNITERPENLNDIIHTINTILQSEVKAKNLNFNIYTIDVTHENVFCDKYKLNQVLLNVLNNAFKYTPEGGTISLKIIEKRVTLQGYCTFEFIIKDDGVGMSQEIIDSLFDPNKRMNMASVYGNDSSGFGLAITKNIIDLAGGTINIKSRENQGTEVSIALELKLQDQELESLEELEGIKALIVDEDTNNCVTGAKMLRKVGLKVDWASREKEVTFKCEEAFRLNDDYKVIFTDADMKELNCQDIIRKLKKFDNNLKVVCVTSKEIPEVEDDLKKAGANYILPKPIFPSDIVGVLKKCFKNEQRVIAKANVGEDTFKGKKILVAEDNEMNREIAIEIFEENGMEVTAVCDGKEAYEKMLASKPGDFDLIIMDIQMPNMNGYEATKAIRAIGKKGVADIPIIAMSANTYEEDINAALEAGMNEHVSKPIDINVVKTAMAKVLNK